MLRRHLIVPILLITACSATEADPRPSPSTTTTRATPETTTAQSTTVATTAPEPARPTGLGDTLVPWAGNHGYDAIEYTWQLQVDPDAEDIEAVATMRAKATHDVDLIALDFTGPSPDYVTYDGTSVDFEYVPPKLTIETAPDTGQSFTVEVGYQGVPEPVGNARGWIRRDDHVYSSAALPGDTASWIPLNDTPLDPAVFRIEVETPAGATALASGVPAESVETSRWETTMPVSEIGLAAGYFQSREVETTDPTITISVPEVRELPDPESVDDLIPDILEHLEGYLGPFPFPTLGLTQVEGELANSTPGQIFLGGFFNPRDIVHEMAHQWIGGSVGTAASRDIWFREGIPEYLSIVWATNQPSGDSLADRLSAMHDQISPSTRVPLEVTEPAHRGDETTYLRGALAIHVLSEAMGDPAFREGVQAFTTDFVGGSASTEDFIETMGQHTTVDLDSTLTPWIGQEAVPSLP